MAKGYMKSVAVSRETASALKVLADEIGTTVGDMLCVVVIHKPDMLQRAYVAADRIAKVARLLEIGQRRMAAASGSGSRSASASPAPAVSGSAAASAASPAPAASAAGSRSAAASSPPAASASSPPAVDRRAPSVPPRT